MTPPSKREAHWARETLRLYVAGIDGGSRRTDDETMKLADAHARAERRDEHVKTCMVHSPMKSPYERDGHTPCGGRFHNGEIWHCPNAPTGGQNERLN